MEYLKTGRALFSRKIRFFQIWAKAAQNDPQNCFFRLLSLVFSGSNLKGKLILLLIFHDQSYIWQNTGC